MCYVILSMYIAQQERFIVLVAPPLRQALHSAYVSWH